jgi:hypothetical protein
LLGGEEDINMFNIIFEKLITESLKEAEANA